MTGHLSHPTHTAVAAIMITFVVLFSANTLVLVKIMNTLMEFPDSHENNKSLPCPAIPTRLILEDPACAQKLIEAMNVTNVHIRRGEALVSRFENETGAQTRRDASQDVER